ncbi:hypothetical protein E4U17_004799 [Claviceps sp. LM77 group G4]|nr:hypothetical protein E4U17_004799 [Claviceps sp. LM77 group G4]
MASQSMKEIDEDLPAKFDALGMRPGSPTKTSSAQIPKLFPAPDSESHPLHPKLKDLSTYVSRIWFEADDTALNLMTATQTDLNGRGPESSVSYIKVWKKFRNVLDINGVPTAALESVSESLAHLMQQEYQTSGDTESEASDRSPIDKGKRTTALSNVQLGPNHPENIGQQFDDSGNSVHTDKASSRTRSHRFYHTEKRDTTPVAGPSHVPVPQAMRYPQLNGTVPRQTHHQSQQFRPHPQDPTRHTPGPAGDYRNTDPYGPPEPQNFPRKLVAAAHRTSELPSNYFTTLSIQTSHTKETRNVIETEF